MPARNLMLAGALAAMAAPSAWSQQASTESETAAREAAAAAAIEAQVEQAEAQAQLAQAQAEAQADQAEAQAQIAQAEVQIRTAERQMAAARAELERAAREVAIQTRRAAVAVDENGLIRFNGGPNAPWVIYSGQGTRAQLGAALVDAEDGARVTAITPDSGAADAGLQVDDIIRSIDGVDLAAATEAPSVAVINRLAAIEPGATVELVVERSGTERNIDVVTQERTPSPWVFSMQDGQQVFLRSERIARNGERLAAAGGRGGPAVVSLDDSLNTIRLFNWTGAPWGDMELVPITPELGRYFQTTEGLLVVRAPSDDAVGLQDGDVILSIGGRTPTSAEHAIRILGSFESGEVIEFALMRDGRRQSLQYTVEETGFEYFSPVTPAPAPAPATPVTPGARSRGPAPAPTSPSPTEPVSPTPL